MRDHSPILRAMTAYVLFVALFNLYVGYRIGRAAPRLDPEISEISQPLNAVSEPGSDLPNASVPPTDSSPQAERGASATITLSVPTMASSDKDAAASTTVEAEMLPDRECDTAAKLTETTESVAIGAAPIPRSWSEFGEWLRNIAERSRYARACGDKLFAKEIAAQMKACVLAWLPQLRQSLEDDSEALRVELFGADVDTSGLELCVAQIETMLANIESFDWRSSVDAIFGFLERERHLLDKSQQVIRGATALHPTT